MSTSLHLWIWVTGLILAGGVTVLLGILIVVRNCFADNAIYCEKYNSDCIPSCRKKKVSAHHHHCATAGLTTTLLPTATTVIKPGTRLLQPGQTQQQQILLPRIMVLQHKDRPLTGTGSSSSSVGR